MNNCQAKDANLLQLVDDKLNSIDGNDAFDSISMRSADEPHADQFQKWSRTECK